MGTEILSRIKSGLCSYDHHAASGRRTDAIRACERCQLALKRDPGGRAGRGDEEAVPGDLRRVKNRASCTIKFTCESILFRELT